MYRIYCITNLRNGKQYVGITKFSLEERLKQHIKVASRKVTRFMIHQAIRKYGEHWFSISLLEETLDTNREAYFIDLLSTHYIEGVGYNMTYGGDGMIGYTHTAEYRENAKCWAFKNHKTKKIGMYGRKHSEETRKKMQESAKLIDRPWTKLKGRISEAGRKRLSDLKKGVKRSPETIRKMIENMPDMSGSKNPMYGRKHSQETKDKIRLNALNRAKSS